MLRSGRVRSALLLPALAACGTSIGSAGPIERATPSRIILLIADGAGVAHWTLAAYADESLPVRRMSTIGLVDTRGADHTVSGSAPTASAYATGERTFMGAISVGMDSLPRETVVEAAIARGMSTGLLTTTAIFDATPAAFAAHGPTRAAYGDLARQMSTKGVTVLMGGGRAAFRPQAQADSSDLLAELQDDYTYAASIAELRALDPDTVDTLLGLFVEGEMGIVSERGTALQDMTSTALTILDRNPEGFFLLVENEESDTQSHRNAPQETVTAEMLDFSAAVGIALEYQASNPETLVLVTGDHETGGVSLTYDRNRDIVMQYASPAHTGTLIPLFAEGPGAERFGGIIRNDRVGQILMEMVRGSGGSRPEADQP